MTQNAIEKLLAEWQTRLRLNDWKIKIVLDPESDCFGKHHGSFWYKEGTVTLRPVGTIPEDWIGCRDQEVTLVHELLHCFLFPVTNKSKTNSGEYAACEQAIELSAQALVAAKRGLLRIDDKPKRKKRK